MVRDGNYGFIDNKGKEVVPFKYDYITPFSDGLASVASGGTMLGALTNGKRGYIDTKGKEIIPCTFKSADSFG